MNPGTMIEVLHGMEDGLGLLIEEPGWNSLLIDYETPHVERLWKMVDGYRLCLHRIHPCEKALYHPHPWPSAVHLLSGTYEMGIGYAEPGATVPVEVARTIYHNGGVYEMIDPRGWHYVKPFNSPCYSIMVMGPLYPADGTVHPKPTIRQRPLSANAVSELLAKFHEWA